MVNPDGGSFILENALEVTTREKSTNENGGCSSSANIKQPPFVFLSILFGLLVFFWKKTRSDLRNK
ncbi:MAG: hypothetical protein PF689_09695, partial [Deltaproteobacteria bacterium]|nr:hypothetical protein [Deltaproteobacteria bacterium]